MPRVSNSRKLIGTGLVITGLSVAFLGLQGSFVIANCPPGTTCPRFYGWDISAVLIGVVATFVGIIAVLPALFRPKN